MQINGGPLVSAWGRRHRFWSIPCAMSARSTGSWSKPEPRWKRRSPELTKALERVLLDIDFMVERKVIPDIRDDIIYVAAREALGKKQKGA